MNYSGEAVMNENLTIETFRRFIREYKPPGQNAGAVSLIDPVLSVLQGKWKNHVLFEMSRKTNVRFSDLKKALPEITNTMLTATLRELEADGLVTRMQFNEIPPHVEYSLTEMGKDLLPVFFELFKWGMKYIY
jgi:DNA-binding HxlR family transcriptional regulator